MDKSEDDQNDDASIDKGSAADGVQDENSPTPVLEETASSESANVSEGEAAADQDA